jgi:Bacteriophage tail sheath protein
MPSSLGSQVQDESGPHQSIARINAAVTAFVGRTLRGPVNRPVRIASFNEFSQVFGGLWQPSLLGYAVEQYFDNGGREAIIVRVVNGARAATLCMPAGSEQLVLRALRPGTREYLRACVDYDNIPNDDDEEFNLTIQRVRTQGTLRVEDQETYRALSVHPGAPANLEDALARSELVRLVGAPPKSRPQRTLDPASGLATGYLYSNSDGDDGGPLTDYDLIGSPSERTGLFALAADDFNFLVIPPISRDRDVGISTLLVAARYCKLRQALLIVDPPMQWHTAEEALGSARDWGFASEDAFMYFPRILALDKLRGRFETFAPCGAVAGMLSRSDLLLPQWAAGETEAPVLRPGYRPSCLVPEYARERLAALGINVIDSVRSAARASQSPRTLAAGNAGSADWQFLASRRFALSVVRSLERGTRWAAIADSREDPCEDPCATVESKVREFFEALRRDGAFGDRSAEEAYFVVCERSLPGQADPTARRFELIVGFAASRSGEYHCYRIAQTPTGGEIRAVTVNRLKYQKYSAGEIEWVERLADQLQPR